MATFSGLIPDSQLLYWDRYTIVSAGFRARVNRLRLVTRTEFVCVDGVCFSRAVKEFWVDVGDYFIDEPLFLKVVFVRCDI